MNNPILYRKRLIPDECVLLKDDKIIVCNEDIIVTKWEALHPKKDLHHGYSCYYLKKGYKVSKFYTADNQLLYWYCDIVSYDYTSNTNTLVVTDLLADVIIYPDGFVKVVDIDEIALCLEDGKITSSQIAAALRQLDSLLNTIYSGDFKQLTDNIDNAISNI